MFLRQDFDRHQSPTDALLLGSSNGLRDCVQNPSDCSGYRSEITLALIDLSMWGTAANETDYKPARHRTPPILASIMPIANYPTKLRIFKTNASRYWQVRFFLKGKT